LGAKVSSLSSILDIARSTGVGKIDLLQGCEQAEITEIHIIEALIQLHSVKSGSLAVLDRHLSEIATTYQLDIAIRVAASKGALGLALFLAKDKRLSVTACELARKTQIALIRLDPAVDLSVAIRTMAQQVTDQIHITIDKIRNAADAIRQVGPSYKSTEELVAVSCVLLGREILIVEDTKLDTDDFLSVPIGFTFTDRSRLLTRRTADDDSNALLELYLWRLAAEINQRNVTKERESQESRQNDAELLEQLLSSGQNGPHSATEIARLLRIPINSKHTVVRMELDNYLPIKANNSFQMRERLVQSIQCAASKESGKWRTCHRPELILLLWTHEKTEISGTSVSQSVARVLAEMVRSTPEIQVFCGIGSTNVNIEGIIASANEALFAASTARTRKLHNHAISFDATGLKKSLIEWYSFASVKHSISTLLSPLNKLSATKKDSILNTISTYLDFNGSLNKTATALHLHRNAVSYRIKHAFELLEVDPNDPDQMLFLHLACRSEYILGKEEASDIQGTKSVSAKSK
jgi:sugar diacid utilization regulator